MYADIVIGVFETGQRICGHLFSCRNYLLMSAHAGAWVAADTAVGRAWTTMAPSRCSGIKIRYCTPVRTLAQ